MEFVNFDWCFLQLKSTFMELQGNNGYMSNSEIAEAEMKRAELLAMKESLTNSLASNYQLRAELQKQVENMLVTQNQGRWKPFQLGKTKVSSSKTANRITGSWSFYISQAMLSSQIVTIIQLGFGVSYKRFEFFVGLLVMSNNLELQSMLWNYDPYWRGGHQK